MQLPYGKALGVESEPRISHWQSLASHVIAQHQLLGIRMEVHLLMHLVGHRIAAQVMLEQRQGHDQRYQALAVVLDEAQEFQPTTGRPCLRWRGGSSGVHQTLAPFCMGSLA